jgi:hypothetical protein
MKILPEFRKLFHGWRKSGKGCFGSNYEVFGTVPGDLPALVAVGERYLQAYLGEVALAIGETKGLGA